KKAKDARSKVFRHGVDEVKSWPTPDSLRLGENERQRRLAELTPLDPPTSADKTAAEIIARLTTSYPFEQFTKIPAVQAATTMSQGGLEGGLGVSPELEVRKTLGRDAQATKDAQATLGTTTLELPRAVRTELKP